jgi:hypothetical protein
MNTLAIPTGALCVALATFCIAAPASAESCTKSRDYILEGLSGQLTRPARIYKDLFRTCMEALTFSNVKDAYVMKDGAVAIEPLRNTVSATAPTLAQFCQRFPNSTARFLTPNEQRRPHTAGLIVMMSSGTATSCKELRGGT